MPATRPLNVSDAALLPSRRAQRGECLSRPHVAPSGNIARRQHTIIIRVRNGYSLPGLALWLSCGRNRGEASLDLASGLLNNSQWCCGFQIFTINGWVS